MSSFTMIYDECLADITRTLSCFDLKGECHNNKLAQAKLDLLKSRWEQLAAAYRHTEVEDVIQDALEAITVNPVDTPNDDWAVCLKYARKRLMWQVAPSRRTQPAAIRPAA